MSDDDDDAAPIKFEFSAESKLDEDHLFYLQFTNNFISNVTRPRDFDHCTRWLERLAGEPMYGVEAKRNRNMYLAMLLIAMQDNRVVGPFHSFPPAGPLPKANEAFGLTEKHDATETSLMFDQRDRELNMADFRFMSEDGRTYTASCALPDGKGVMGYVGISTGGGEGLWINKEGENICIDDLCPERIETLTTNTPVRKQAELYDSYDFRHPKAELKKPFSYLFELPESSSAHKLVTTGSYKFSKHHSTLLRETYAAELVHKLECLMVEQKKNIEKILRQRHNKVVTQLYESYRSEVEKGLLDYKEARQEWLEVFTVVDEVRRVMAETSTTITTTVRSNNQQMNMLHSTLVDARKRHQMCTETGKSLEAHKDGMHRAIHDMTIQHKHDLERMCTTVEGLCVEIRRLRNENRRKQQVIDGLCKDIDG